MIQYVINTNTLRPGTLYKYDICGQRRYNLLQWKITHNFIFILRLSHSQYNWCCCHVIKIFHCSRFFQIHPILLWLIKPRLGETRFLHSHWGRLTLDPFNLFESENLLLVRTWTWDVLGRKLETGSDLGHGRHGGHVARLSLGQHLRGEEAGKWTLTRKLKTGYWGPGDTWGGHVARRRHPVTKLPWVNTLSHQTGRQLLLGHDIGLTWNKEKSVNDKLLQYESGIVTGYGISKPPLI